MLCTQQKLCAHRAARLVLPVRNLVDMWHASTQYRIAVVSRTVDHWPRANRSEKSNERREWQGVGHAPVGVQQQVGVAAGSQLVRVQHRRQQPLDVCA